MIVSYFMRYNNENDIREGSIRQLNRKKNKNSNAGMTLLEVIVAVSIFSITAIVLLQSFDGGNQSQEVSGSSACV